MTQALLDFSTPALVPVDPHVDPQDRDRLTGAALAMYLRLRQGPATESQLRLAGAGNRVAARRLDCNTWLRRRGSSEFIPKAVRQPDGEWVYRLEVGK